MTFWLQFSALARYGFVASGTGIRHYAGRNAADGKPVRAGGQRGRRFFGWVEVVGSSTAMRDRLVVGQAKTQTDDASDPKGVYATP
jgi:hypothetical protein